MTPTIGRIVHYKLSPEDIGRIQARRAAAGFEFNTHDAGDIVPLVIVRVWPDEWGPGIPGVNGQALLDGPDTAWVTSAREGSEPGQWSWPERVS